MTYESELTTDYHKALDHLHLRTIRTAAEGLNAVMDMIYHRAVQIS